VEEDEEDDKDRERPRISRPEVPRIVPPAPISSTSRGAPSTERKAQSHSSDREDQPRNELVLLTSRNASPTISRSISPPSHKTSGRKDRGPVVHHLQHFPFEFVVPDDSRVEFPLINHGGVPTSDSSMTALAMSHINVPDAPVNVGIGSKRRLASLDSSASSSRGPSQPSNGPRRRARNSRVGSAQHVNSSIAGSREHSNTSPVTGYEAMDVEERPRKTARR